MILRLCKILLILSLITGCATVPGPVVQICVIEQERGGIDCAMKDGSQVLLPWTGLKEEFLGKFDRAVCLPSEDYISLLKWGHR